MNYETFADFSVKNKYPIQAKLEADLEDSASEINFNISPTLNSILTVTEISAQNLRFLKQLNVKVVKRLYDRGVDRKSHDIRGDYNPLNFMYNFEIEKLQRIGLGLDRRVAGGVSTS